MTGMIIDGAQGEGGGQIFRTALTLAMCLGLEITINNIRAGRAKPGLLRQHLACLKAAKEMSDAEVQGDQIGSCFIRFKPKKIKAGKYAFAVGTAGSTTLIFQTILLPLLYAEGESEITFEGGTHNPMAPSFDFLEQSFLRCVKTMGAKIEVQLEAYGFNPAGGGRWRAQIIPLTKLQALVLKKVDERLLCEAVATSSKIPGHVGERELAQVEKLCGWSESQLTHRFVDSVGAGNVISLRVNSASYTAVFEAFAAINTSAERVASQAVNAYKRYERAQVPVCEHLADQLILPMAMGSGGQFLTEKPSQHLLTNIAVIEQMTKVKINLSQVNKTSWRVEVLV